MITLIIIIITAAVSIFCFKGTLAVDALKFNAYDTWHRKQWYRMLSYGLVHGSWGHLFFNMLTLYFFGTVVERYFQAAFGHSNGIILYLILYVSAIVVSTIGDLVKYRDTPGYSAVGASGAVSSPSRGISSLHYTFFTAGTWRGRTLTTSATPPISGEPCTALPFRCSSARTF